VVEAGEDLLIVSRDGSVNRLEEDSAELAREVLAFFARPHDEAELIAYVEGLAGPLGEREQVVRDLLALLRDTGAVETARDGLPQRGINIVVAVSGAIAASHAPALVSALQRRGNTVEVALTQTAQRFVATETLAALVQREVHTSMWPRAAHLPVPHIALARWAQLVVVYPASATTIARIANGDYSDLVSAIALTTEAPVLVLPSMNIAMYESPAVQRNLDILRDDGYLIVHGVPSQEVADAPSTRTTLGGAAPAAGEVAALLDALRGAGIVSEPELWEGAYQRGVVPWASETCDADIADVLAELAPPPRRLLDVGCGLGQVARYAADIGYRVVATDLSETALALARQAAGTRDSAHEITWLRDDICETALAGLFDVIVDRATLHTLSRPRAHAWAAAMRKLAAPDATLIVKVHRDGIPSVTHSWTAAALAELLPDFTLVAERDAELPGIQDQTPIASMLFVLRRR
jgi:SAM-dependent methyltransferase